MFLLSDTQSVCVFVWMRWDKPALAPPPAAPASFWPGPGCPFARRPSPFPGRCGCRVFERVVGGGVVCWARSSRWSWASGLPAVEEACCWREHHCWLCCWSESRSSWKLPGPEGTSVSVCDELQDTLRGGQHLTLGGSGTNDGGGLASRCTSLLAGFFNRSWGTGMGLCVKVKKVIKPFKP